MLVLAILAACASTAGAASAQWSGAVDASWATAGNWSVSPAPGTGDTATFDLVNNGHTTISLGAGVTVQNLIFNRNNSTAYTIGAGAVGSETLTLNHGGSITLADNWPDPQQDATINAAVVLGTDAGTGSYSFSSLRMGTRLTMAGPISGGSGGAAGTKTLTLESSSSYLLVDGAIGGGGGTIAVTVNGYMYLSGANTFTGPLTMSSGSLAVPTINNSGVAGPLGAGTSPVQLNGDLSYTGPTASSTKKFTLGGSSGISVGAATTELTLNGVIDGSGMLAKSGSGTLVLSGINTYSTGTGINRGTLRLSGSGTLGGNSGYLVLGPDTKLELNGTSQTVSNLWGTGGTIVNNGSGVSTLTVTTGSGTFAGVIADNDNSSSGTVALTHGGTGTLTLTGSNTYSGATSITAGVVALSGSGTLGNATGTTTVGAGATLAFSGLAVGAEAVRISGTGAAGCNGALTGASSTYAGLLQLGAASTVSADSGLFDLTNAGTITGATFGLTLTGSGSGSLAGVIGTTSGTVTKTGTGTWTLSGANTFTGALTVSAGTLAVPVVNNASVAGPLGLGATGVTLGGSGTLSYTGATASSTKPFTLTGNSNVISIASAATELTLSGLVSGAGSFEKAGPGTLVLTAGNTYGAGSGYTAGTNLSAGTLRLSGSGKLGGTTTHLYLTGGTLDLGGTSQTVADFSGTGGTILNNGSGTSLLTLSITNTPSDFYGRILDNDNSGPGIVALTNTGTGTLTLHGANTYSGTTTIGANTTIMLADSGTLGSPAGGTTVSGGGTLLLYQCASCAEAVTISGAGTVTGYNAALSGYNSTLAGLLKLAAASTISTRNYGVSVAWFDITNPGTITGSGHALTLRNGMPQEQGTLASIIGTGAGTLTKTGPGLWILTGANTYTGATTVSEGILNIRNSSALGGTAGGTTVASGATLQIQGNLNIGAEGLNLAGPGAGGYATGALENVSGSNNYGGLVTLGAASTISSDSGTLALTNAGTISGSTYGLTLAGAGDGSLASIIGTGGGTLTKTGGGNWALTGLNTFTGRTFIQNGTLEIKTLRNVSGGSSSLGAPTTAANGTIDMGASTASGTLRFTGTSDASSNRVVNLAGTTGGATLDSSGPSNNKLVITSALTATGLGNKTLTLTGTSTGANEISGLIPNSTGFKTSVNKTGAGSWTLSAANSYTGNTSVAAGTLTLTNAFLADAADVSLTTGGILNLAFAATDTVRQLFIDGLAQSAGTWGGPSSAATHKTSLLAGSGMLLVGSGPALPPYASWVAGCGLTGADAAFAADPDHDGIANGMEWVLGGDPLANNAGILPQAAGNQSQFTMTFHRNDASESGLQLVVQWGTGLLAWSDLAVGASSSGPEAHGITISVVENGAAADTITVTIPAANAVQGNLFMRLRAGGP